MSSYIVVADLASTLLSRFSRRAVPGCTRNVCPHCMRYLHVPPCAGKHLGNLNNVVMFCLQCAREHHPEEYIHMLWHCSAERQLIKTAAEMN